MAASCRTCCANCWQPDGRRKAAAAAPRPAGRPALHTGGTKVPPFHLARRQSRSATACPSGCCAKPLQSRMLITPGTTIFVRNVAPRLFRAAADAASQGQKSTTLQVGIAVFLQNWTHREMKACQRMEDRCDHCRHAIRCTHQTSTARTGAGQSIEPATKEIL